MWKDSEVPLWGVELGTPGVLWKGMLWRISWRDLVQGLQVPLWGDVLGIMVVSF